MKRKPVLLFIYNSFKDPLFQNILLSYIREIQSTSKEFSFHVITFEQKEFPVPPSERKVIFTELQQQQIFWYPLPYHSGKFILLKKTWDGLVTVFKVGYLKFKYHVKLVIAFANVSASFSYLLTRLFGMRLMIYSYEPHSLFMKELGLWSEKSLRFKILYALEKRAGLEADVVLTGTQFMVDELVAIKRKGKVLRAPTAVNEDVYFFLPDGRKKWRRYWKAESRLVVTYIGKFGDLYYSEELIAFLSGLYEMNKNFFFVIVTRYPHNKIVKWFTEYGVPGDSYFLSSDLTNLEVREYMSASDLGISAVPPSPSQKFRSPTKVGEYLMCGLPYITCAGVSEDDLYAKRYKIGVVVKEFSQNEAKDQYPAINYLLRQNSDELRTRCRAAGIEYRSQKKVVTIIKNNLGHLV